MKRKCFAPVEKSDARVLILGSMPGVESLRQNQYYAFKHNKFWQIMSELIGFENSLSYEKRCAVLVENRIALWDVLADCHRPGSLDSAISQEQANDFESFFREHKNLQAIFFNGQKAGQCFKKHVLKKLPTLCASLKITVLPSTSPANAGTKYDAKLKAWREILDYI